jgi:serine 3-dehydrogenase
METMNGKIAVVTGASAGIGAATARTLSAAGATVLLVARRQDRLKALQDELGGETAILTLDLAREDAAQAMFDYVQTRFGHADILVNNAGMLRAGTFETFDLDNLRPMIALNYETVVRSTILFARAMKERGSGQIVNISSIGAHLTAAGSGIYGGLKRALEIFTDSSRIELAGSGVKVGIVSPGTTSTEVFDEMKSRGEAGWDEYVPALEAEDIAKAVRYMCEQSSRANVARVHVYSASEMF